MNSGFFEVASAQRKAGLFAQRFKAAGIDRIILNSAPAIKLKGIGCDIGEFLRAFDLGV